MLRNLIIVACILIGFTKVNTQNVDSLYATANYAEVIPFLQEQFSTDTSNIELMTKLGNTFFQLGDTKSSLLYYSKMIFHVEDDAATLKRLATIYELEENTPKALKYYLKLSKLFPENAVYYRKVANQYAKAGERQGAFRNYLKSYQLNKRDLLTIKSLTEMYLEQDNVESADSVLWDARAYDPLNISYCLLSARSKYKQKQHDSVIVVMEGMRGRLDFNNYYNKLLGYSYMKVDSIDKAIVRLERSLVDEGNPEMAHYYLSEAYSRKGDDKAYVFHLKKAMKSGISDNMAKYHRSMAKFYDDNKNLKEAIPHYESAYRYSNEPRFLFFLARAYDAYYADKSTAVRYYKKYIASSDTIEEYKTYARDRSRVLKEQIHLTKTN